MFRWQHEAQPLQQDSPQQIIVLDDTDSDEGAGQQVQQGDAGAEGGPSEQLIAANEQQRQRRMYPNSFQTSDMKHVVDNILGECLGVMRTCLGLWIAAKPIANQTVRTSEP